MEKLYIVIPAYKERETVRRVIEEWYPIVEKVGGDSRLVVVNDGSKDDTYEIMQECAKDKPRFIPLTKQNGGHGATVLHAYRYALDEGADYIFQTDSDGQTVPGEFWPFWERRHDYDMVIGKRDSREDGLSRILVTKVLKLTLMACFGTVVVDANTPFRLMKADTLRENIDLIPKDFNLSNVLVSVIYEKKKLRVKYLPITFLQRQGGVNSINIGKIFAIGLQAVKDFWVINKSLKGMEK